MARTFHVTCKVVYRRTWSNIEAETEEEAIKEAEVCGLEADDFPGDCTAVGEWEAIEAVK